MSLVTNVILSFSILEAWEPFPDEDFRNVVRRVNEFFGESGGFIEDAMTHEKESLWSGGTKALERPTFVGAFNFLNIEKFIAHVRLLPWKEPEDVQLIICEQEDDAYRIIFPCAGGTR